MKHPTSLGISARCNRIMLVLCLLLQAASSSCWSQTADAGLDFFETKIRPVLVEQCYQCHASNAKKLQGGLLADSRQGLLDGGESGPAVVPGKPAESLLLSALKYESFEMPPAGKLSDEVIADFEKWIAIGAPDPRNQQTQPASRPKGIDWQTAREFWAFSPRKPSLVPATPNSWAHSAIDAFVAAKHADAGLHPVAEATRATWLRRVYFDLVGLPPSAEDVLEFTESTLPDAYERVVDRLLTSPRYGERWGRHWLDLARYADSNGADENHSYPVAWRYRDYVVRAFNSDVPYDRFVIEQLAGDLLVGEGAGKRATRQAERAAQTVVTAQTELTTQTALSEQTNVTAQTKLTEQATDCEQSACVEADQREAITATGFLVIGPKMLAEQDKPKLVADYVDEQIDTFGKVFLGLTLGCARCHDHKFDPITAEDYYGLAGVFHSTKSMAHLEFVSQWNERELPDEVVSRRIAEHSQLLDPAQRELEATELSIRDAEFAKQRSRAIAAMRSTAFASAVTEEELQRLGISRSDMEALAGKISASSNDRQAGIFRVWRELSLPTQGDFESRAGALWSVLKEERTKAEKTRSSIDPFIAKLLDRALPKSLEELIALYDTALDEAWKQVRSAERDKEGNIKDKVLSRLHRQLFGKQSAFVYAEKVEELLQGEAQKEFLAQRARVEQLVKAKPALDLAMAADDASVKLVAVHARGNHLNLVGPPLARQVPAVFEGTTPAVRFPTDKSGRLELAQWLVDPQHPLTARVMANRIWQGHFGEGIVRSSSNFGIKGDPPSHPALLDWLAEEFVRQQWSIKGMHRRIVLSSTYRLASNSQPAEEQIDPDNRWLWRQNRRRLEVEPFRDALLVVGGYLDLELGGEARAIYGEKFEDSGEPKSIHDAARRTIYLPINRAALEDFFATFDYVDSAVSLEKRPTTTVPHQALFIMNHRLPIHAGWRLAQRIKASTASDSQRIEVAFLTALGRKPTEREVSATIEFIRAHAVDSAGPESASDAARPDDPWLSFCRALLLTNEFIYVD